MDRNILVLSNISKSYRQGSEYITIFDNFNLTVDKGEFISITGPSGSGKTTLLNLVGLIDSIDKGEILLNAKIISNQNSNKKSEIRRNNFGFIYQNYNLFDNFSAIENITLPLILRGETKDIAIKKADKLMSGVNITANKNTVPFDPESPFVTSGLRLGSPAMTSRGMKAAEFAEIGDIIAERLLNPEDEVVAQKCRDRVASLCNAFPLYPHMMAKVPSLV